MKAYPASWSAWLAALSMLAGGLLGWLLHPLVWLGGGGPIRWAALLMSRAAAESQWNKDAVGDAGMSAGILQFYAPTWDALMGPAFDRFSPFWSGYAAAKYVQGALLADVRWFSLRIPFYGTSVMALLWRCGPSQRSADRWTEAGDYTEEVASSAGLVWGLAFGILSIPFWAWALSRVRVKARAA